MVYLRGFVLKKQLQHELSLHKILQILGVSLFEQLPVLWGRSNTRDSMAVDGTYIHLQLFNLQLDWTESQ